jgi:hypothetical protein
LLLFGFSCGSATHQQFAADPLRRFHIRRDTFVLVLCVVVCVCVFRCRPASVLQICMMEAFGGLRCRHMTRMMVREVPMFGTTVLVLRRP